MVRSPAVNRTASALAAITVLGLAAGPSQAYDLRYLSPRWHNPGNIGIVSCYYQCHVNRVSNSPTLYKVCVNNLTGNQVSLTWIGSRC